MFGQPEQSGYMALPELIGDGITSPPENKSPDGTLFARNTMLILYMSPEKDREASIQKNHPFGIAPKGTTGKETRSTEPVSSEWQKNPDNQLVEHFLLPDVDTLRNNMREKGIDIQPGLTLPEVIKSLKEAGIRTIIINRLEIEVFSESEQDPQSLGSLIRKAHEFERQLKQQRGEDVGNFEIDEGVFHDGEEYYDPNDPGKDPRKNYVSLTYEEKREIGIDVVIEELAQYGRYILEKFLFQIDATVSSPIIHKLYPEEARVLQVVKKQIQMKIDELGRDSSLLNFVLAIIPHLREIQVDQAMRAFGFYAKGANFEDFSRILGTLGIDIQEIKRQVESEENQTVMRNS